MNESRWGLIKRDVFADRTDTGETFEETSAYLKNWINNRVEWLHNGSGNSTPLKTGA